MLTAPRRTNITVIGKRRVIYKGLKGRFIRSADSHGTVREVWTTQIISCIFSFIYTPQRVSLKAIKCVRMPTKVK